MIVNDNETERREITKKAKQGKKDMVEETVALCIKKYKRKKLSMHVCGSSVSRSWKEQAFGKLGFHLSRWLWLMVKTVVMQWLLEAG